MAKTATKVRKKVKKNVAEGIAHIHASFQQHDHHDHRPPR
jgi:ribosomal protein S11